MKWKEDQRFDCETYLQTLAMGIHSPVAEEHVANCPFCRDIYHGGTEEFPLSLKEEAIKMRAEKRRKARRKFLGRVGLVAAGVIATTTVQAVFFADTESNAPVADMWTRRQNAHAVLDSIYASKGRAGVAGYVVDKSTWKVLSLIAWVKDRQHAPLYDLLVTGLVDGRRNVAKAALLALREVDPVDLKPHLAALERAVDQVVDRRLVPLVQRLIGEVETS